MASSTTFPPETPWRLDSELLSDGGRRYFTPGLEPETWHVVGSLGKGGFGEVLQERCTQGPSVNQLRAVKKIGKILGISKYRRELDILAKFAGPSSDARYKQSFVQFHGWFEDDAHIYISLEFVPYNDLQHYIRDNRPFEEAETASIVGQVARAIQFMHAVHVMHRDLKPANILVATPRPDWHVKLADFGISKNIQDSATRTLVGTEGFVAPEYYSQSQYDRNNSYNLAVDIWSLGVVAFLLRTGRFPFPNGESLMQYKFGLANFPSELLSRSTVGFDWFVKSLMERNPQDRPDIHKVVDHTWLQQYNQTSPTTEQNTQPSPVWDDAKASAVWDSRALPEYGRTVRPTTSMSGDPRTMTSTQRNHQVPYYGEPTARNSSHSEAAYSSASQRWNQISRRQSQETSASNTDPALPSWQTQKPRPEMTHDNGYNNTHDNYRGLDSYGPSLAQYYPQAPHTRTPAPAFDPNTQRQYQAMPPTNSHQNPMVTNIRPNDSRDTSNRQERTAPVPERYTRSPYQDSLQGRTLVRDQTPVPPRIASYEERNHSAPVVPATPKPEFQSTPDDSESYYERVANRTAARKRAEEELENSNATSNSGESESYYEKVANRTAARKRAEASEKSDERTRSSPSGKSLYKRVAERTAARKRDAAAAAAPPPAVLEKPEPPRTVEHELSYEQVANRTAARKRAEALEKSSSSNGRNITPEPTKSSYERVAERTAARKQRAEALEKSNHRVAITPEPTKSSYERVAERTAARKHAAAAREENPEPLPPPRTFNNKNNHHETSYNPAAVVAIQNAARRPGTRAYLTCLRCNTSFHDRDDLFEHIRELDHGVDPVTLKPEPTRGRGHNSNSPPNSFFFDRQRAARAPGTRAYLTCLRCNTSFHDRDDLFAHIRDLDHGVDPVTLKPEPSSYNNNNNNNNSINYRETWQPQPQPQPQQAIRNRANLTCLRCNRRFNTRNALFEHLEQRGHGVSLITLKPEPLVR